MAGTRRARRATASRSPGTNFIRRILYSLSAWRRPDGAVRVVEMGCGARGGVERNPEDLRVSVAERVEMADGCVERQPAAWCDRLAERAQIGRRLDVAAIVGHAQLDLAI